MTATLSPITASNAFWSVANDDDLCEAASSISPERCITWLLDLQASTSDQQLKDLVDETVADVRALGRFGGDMEDVVLGALASIEVAFEVRTAA
jgi:hypothetical protein